MDRIRDDTALEMGVPHVGVVYVSFGDDVTSVTVIELVA